MKIFLPQWYLRSLEGTVSPIRLSFDNMGWVMGGFLTCFCLCVELAQAQLNDKRHQKTYRKVSRKTL